jgi:hypothetical protein
VWTTVVVNPPSQQVSKNHRGRTCGVMSLSSATCPRNVTQINTRNRDITNNNNPTKYHSVRDLFLYPRIDKSQTRKLSEFSPEHSSIQTEGQESLQCPSSIKISRSDDRNETYPYFRVAELAPDVCWLNATKNPEYCGFNQSRFTLRQPTLARGPGVRPTKATNILSCGNNRQNFIRSTSYGGSHLG